MCARNCEAEAMTAPIEPAPGVLVFTSATMSTTSTVVYEAGRAVLVDPAWEEPELDRIAGALATRALEVVCGWAMHAHHDHLLWHPRFGQAPRLATPRAAAAAVEHIEEIRVALEPSLPEHLRELAGQVRGYDGAPLPWPGPLAQVVTHQGHSPGHGALWLPEGRVLVAGDMLSDREIPLAAETGIAAYAEGLEVLAPYVERARLVIPGHGTPAVADAAADTAAEPADSPRSRLAADRGYLAALRGGRGAEDPRLRSGPQWLRDEHEANLRARG